VRRCCARGGRKRRWGPHHRKMGLPGMGKQRRWLCSTEEAVVLRLCLGGTVRRGTEDGNILIGVTSVARAQQWQPVERQESEEGGAVPPTRKMGVAAADPSGSGSGLHAGGRSRQLPLGNGGQCPLEEETHDSLLCWDPTVRRQCHQVLKARCGARGARRGA
jgi:hypothetical protein